MKSQRILVPQKMRECLLRKLHRVHQGVDKSIQRARDKWFWPGMCPSCLEHQPRQKQAAVIPVITTNAMQILGCDIFQHAGRWHSCIVDYDTGYPWVKPIKNQEADTVIQHFQCLQSVWLPYGGSERSRLLVHFQRLPGTLFESQHHPQARDPSLSVEERPLRKCHWEAQKVA